MLEAIRSAGATVAFFTEMADAVVVEALARSQNLSVPGDLSIVVLGAHIRPQQSGTRFTTFSIPREEMARQATQMLCERIEANSAGGQKLLACEPVEGDTLGAIPASGTDVREYSADIAIIGGGLGGVAAPLAALRSRRSW